MIRLPVAFRLLPALLPPASDLLDLLLYVTPEADIPGPETTCETGPGGGQLWTSGILKSDRFSYQIIIKLARFGVQISRGDLP